MAEQPKLQLNKAGLRDFIDHQIAPFKEGLEKIANENTDDGVTMDSLLGEDAMPDDDDLEIFNFQHPLPIGDMSLADSLTKGEKIVSKINESGKSISEIFQDQIKLFGDLNDNLDKTIQKLMQGQHDSLEKIDGKIFIDGLGPVPGDLLGTNGNSDS